ncbi:MAG: MFS transporter, partial [Paracoccaceae bacterium]
MSKSRNLFFLSSLSLVFIFSLAYNFADRNITELPSEPRTINAEYDFDLKIIAAANASNAPREAGGTLGLGRKALDEEITAWDLEIAPDGTGLPVGSGSVSYG